MAAASLLCAWDFTQGLTRNMHNFIYFHWLHGLESWHYFYFTGKETQAQTAKWLAEITRQVNVRARIHIDQHHAFR